MMAFLVTGMDTTILSLAAAVRLFAEHPEQWDALRADPSLVPAAYLEVLRIASPVTVFSRVTTRAWECEDVTIPAGDRVAVMFASANRDERKWADPERFDITRNPADHLTFGVGIHACVGQNLAEAGGPGPPDRTAGKGAPVRDRQARVRREQHPARAEQASLPDRHLSEPRERTRPRRSASARTVSTPRRPPRRALPARPGLIPGRAARRRPGTTLPSFRTCLQQVGLVPDPASRAAPDAALRTPLKRHRHRAGLEDAAARDHA
ncbi:cytochrome P450 [Streptomyces sp. NPDC013187]|uniref:cytochrome P450 n=1 Tax=Streptomyces sp. NPDC013187 TaxID=3364865 RepID=UPI003679F8C0